MGSYRPTGITALAIIFIIFGFTDIVIGVTVEIMAFSWFNNRILESFWTYIFSLTSPPEFWPIHPFIIFLTGYFDTLSIMNLAHLAAIILFISSVPQFVASMGLLLMKRWGYYLALIIGILNIVVGVVTLINLVIGIILVCYLMGDVKYEFE
ncbi:MAG: hypothetical protein QXS27_05005 [Candidatus Jordarchaeaceae archaeon]